MKSAPGFEHLAEAEAGRDRTARRHRLGDHQATGPGVSGVLGGQQPDWPSALHDDNVTEPHRRTLDGVERDCGRFHHRGLFVRQSFEDSKNAPLRHGDVVREAAVRRRVGGDAVRFREDRVAVLCVARPTHGAKPARGSDGHHDPVTLGDPGDARTRRLDGPSPLMAEHRWRQHLRRHEGVDVGAAHPAVADPHRHLTCTRCWLVDVREVHRARGRNARDSDLASHARQSMTRPVRRRRAG